MHTSRSPRGGGLGAAVGHVREPAALPAVFHATHLLGLTLGSTLGKLRESGVTAAKMFGKAEEQALLLRMMREAAGKGRVLRRALERLRVRQRFGAIGKKGSVALIERLWRTLKNTLGLRVLRPLVAEDLMEKVELGLFHYAHFRPHQALGGATPAEIYFGRTPAHLSAIPPPRGQPGEGPMDSPFRIDYLDAERLLPVLARKAA